MDSFQDDYMSADGDSELPIVLAACLTSIGQLLHRFAELSRVKAVGLSYNCIRQLYLYDVEHSSAQAFARANMAGAFVVGATITYLGAKGRSRR